MKLKRICDFFTSVYYFFNKEELEIKKWVMIALVVYEEGMREQELLWGMTEMGYSRQKIFIVLDKLKNKGVIEKVLISGHECTSDWGWKIIT